jgi:hypothetical protein
MNQEDIKNMGSKACKDGLQRIPYYDEKLVSLIKEGFNAIESMTSWLKGWDIENLKIIK